MFVTPETAKAMRDFAVRVHEGRSPAQAVDAFMAELYTDEAVAKAMEEWSGEILRNAAKNLLYSVARKGGYAANHHQKTASIHETKPLDISLMTRWGAAVSQGYGFQLPSGTKLGDANRDELRHASHKFAAYSTEAANKVRWLELIAQGLSAGERVRDRYKPIRLTELAIEAEKTLKKEAA